MKENTERNNPLNLACTDIQIDKSSMNESEIEKDLENYDYRNYKGIEEDRRKLHYNENKMNFIGVTADDNKGDEQENVPENEEKVVASTDANILPKEISSE